MKSRKTKLTLLLITLTGVVAWNTPSSEDLILGTSNTASSSLGQLEVLGSYNQVNGRSVLIVGDSNQMSQDATSSTDEWKYSIVAGTNNILQKGSGGGRHRNIISGDSNTVDATNCLVTGYGNTLGTGPSGIICYQSAAIGQSNQLMASRAWTIGAWNEHTADYTATLGIDLKANVAKSVAIGRYNAPMESNDVVVIGSGVSDTNRQTALRVTDDGGVILGRAQGDISMGIYQ